MQVEDVQSELNALAGDSRASRKTEPHEQLVRLDVVLDQSLLVRELEHVIDLEESQALDVDRPTLLIRLVIEVRVHSLHLIVLLEVERLNMLVRYNLHPGYGRHHSPSSTR